METIAHPDTGEPLDRGVQAKTIKFAGQTHTLDVPGWYPRPGAHPKTTSAHSMTDLTEMHSVEGEMLADQTLGPGSPSEHITLIFNFSERRDTLDAARAITDPTERDAALDAIYRSMKAPVIAAIDNHGRPHIAVTAMLESAPSMIVAGARAAWRRFIVDHLGDVEAVYTISRNEIAAHAL